MNALKCSWMFILKCNNRYWIWFMRKWSFFGANESISALLVAVSRKWIRIFSCWTAKGVIEFTCYRKQLFEQSVLLISEPLSNLFFKKLAFLTFTVCFHFKSGPSSTCTAMKCYLYSLFKTNISNWKSNPYFHN